MNESLPGSEDGIALLRRAQRGDADAFCDLVREHEERLFRQAFSLCGDGASAEDLAQDTLFTAWRRIGQYDSRCRLFTWLCGILIHQSRNAARKQRPVPVSALPEASRESVERTIESLVEPGDSPAEDLVRHERAAIILRCVDRLPKHHREVVYLRFYVDDSLEGIAAALGCSLGTVKSRLFNALDKLNAMPELSRLVEADASPIALQPRSSS